MYLYVFIVILVICLTHTTFMSSERVSTDVGYLDSDSFRGVSRTVRVPTVDDMSFLDADSFRDVPRTAHVPTADDMSFLDEVTPLIRHEVFRTETDPKTLVNCIKCEKRLGPVCRCFKK